MAFKQFSQGGQGGLQKKMYDVSGLNIKCRDCGATITELPFNPDPERLDTIRCQDCMRKWREQNPRPKRRF